MTIFTNKSVLFQRSMGMLNLLIISCVKYMGQTQSVALNKSPPSTYFTATKYFPFRNTFVDFNLPYFCTNHTYLLYLPYLPFVPNLPYFRTYHTYLTFVLTIPTLLLYLPYLPLVPNLPYFCTYHTYLLYLPFLPTIPTLLLYLPYLPYFCTYRTYHLTFALSIIFS